MSMHSVAVLAALVLPLSATPGIASPPGTAVTVQSRPVGPDRIEHRILDPIGVELVMLSQPVAGTDLVMRATLTPQMPGVKSATMSVTVPAGVRVSGGESRVVSFDAGLPASLSFTVRGRPGTHLVSVQARTESTAGMVGGYGQGYLVLPAAGTGEFHPDQLPAPTVAGRTAAVPLAADSGPVISPGDETPGPAREPNGLPVELPPLQDDDGVSASSHSTFVVTGCWHYLTETGGSLRQRGATVEVWDDDISEDDRLWTGVTGSDGCFTSSGISRSEEIFSGNQDVYVVFYTASTWASVKTTADDIYNWATGTTTIGSQDVHDIGGHQPGSSEFAGRVYQYVMNGADFARNRMLVGGLTPVRVLIPDACTFYTRSDDTIHLCADNVDDRSPDDVLHEYGHYLQDKAYNDVFWPSPGGAHSLCGDSQHRGLSWTEGLADFFGPRANNEMAPVNGANGDVLYNRPLDGSLFSVNMETGSCAGLGDDTELNVARALWDLRDSANDGLDSSADLISRMGDVLETCDDAHYQDYFGGACSWASMGGSNCNFLRTASQNRIDYNANPTTSVTSQPAFAWLRGTVSLSATASDSDPACALSVNFRVSPDSVCSDTDFNVGSDFLAPYSLSFDTRLMSDDTSVFTCARANDGVENAPGWSRSPQWGIDNTAPVLTATLSGIAGNAGWYRSNVTVSLACSDGMSGVASRTYRLNGGPATPYSGPVQISVQGTTSFEGTCTDAAGNTDVEARTIRIDSQAPTAVVVTPAQNTGGTYTVSWNAADPTSGLVGNLAVQERSLTTSFTTVCSTPVSGTSASGSCGRTVLPGQYCYRIVVSDVAGNVLITDGSPCTTVL